MQYTEKESIALFAYVSCVAYLSPLLGAWLADGSWGRYHTIWRFGQAYVIGLVIVTLAASLGPSIRGEEATTAATTTATPTTTTTTDESTSSVTTSHSMDSTSSLLLLQRILTFGGLFLVCLGTGGIKACVSAFGADQVGGLFRPVSSPETNGIDNIGPSEMNTTRDQETNQNQPTEERDEQLRAFFAYFYFGINIGAVTSIACVPLIRAQYGFAAAFSLPTAFMLLAILVFRSRQEEYIHNNVPSKEWTNESDGAKTSTTSTNPPISATFRICWWILRHKLLSSSPRVSRLVPAGWKPAFPLTQSMPLQPRLITRRRGNRVAASDGRRGRHTLVPNDDCDHALSSEPNDYDLKEKHSDQEEGNDENDNTEHEENKQLDEAAQALHALPIIALFPIYWCLYDQQGSVWTLQASRMALHGLEPEQMTLVNPVEILLFIPLFDRIIYPAMETRGWNISPLRRMTWGMALAAISFFVSGWVESSIQYRSDHGLPPVHVFWQLPQLTILAVSEIFLSVTGYEFTYAAAPERLKSFIMAIYLLMMAVGDFVGGLLYSTVFKQLSIAVAMHICGVLMLINLALFRVVSRWWLRHDYTVWRQRPARGDQGQPETVEMAVIVPEVRMV